MSTVTPVTVAVHWGPRPETSREQAARWLELLARLTRESGGGLANWRWDEDPGPGEPVPATAEAFAAALDVENTADDVDIIGRRAYVVAGVADGGYARLVVSAGGSDEYTPFSAVLKLFAGPSAPAVPLADRLAEALVALADVWDADTGLAYDRALFRTVEQTYGLEASDPRCGWSVHLSANRAARVPGDFQARRLPTAHGGAVFDLAAVPGETPGTETVLAAHRLLADSGALEPLPVPAATAKL